jgi:hypothetical protein
VEPNKLEPELRTIAPTPFEKRVTQRIADSDARAFLAFAIIGVFLVVFAVDVDACLVLRFARMQLMSNMRLRLLPAQFLRRWVRRSRFILPITLDRSFASVTLRGSLPQ